MVFHCKKCHKRVYETIEMYKQLVGRRICLDMPWSDGFIKVKRESQAAFFHRGMSVIHTGGRSFYYC